MQRCCRGEQRKASRCSGHVRVDLHITCFVWELCTLISQTIKTTGSESENIDHLIAKQYSTGKPLVPRPCSGMTQGMWQRAQNTNLTSKFTRLQLNRASVEHLRTSVTHGGHTGGGGAHKYYTSTVYNILN